MNRNAHRAGGEDRAPVRQADLEAAVDAAAAVIMDDDIEDDSIEMEEAVRKLRKSVRGLCGRSRDAAADHDRRPPARS
jgi:hypothetical protein